MKLPLTSALAFAGSALAIHVTYDSMFDQGSTSLGAVACSNGKNGLESKGFTTFLSLPNFPHIGAAPAVTGWDSVGCGTCWALTFNNITINILAIDSTDSPGFNIAESTMNTFTDGHAEMVGAIDAAAVQVAPSGCGL